MFSVTQTDYSYPGAHSSIKALDFRNFVFPEFDDRGKPDGRFVLRNGTWKYRKPDDVGEISLESVDFLSGNAALVLLSCFAAGGSSSSWGEAYVFVQFHRRLKVTQVMDWDTHFDAGRNRKHSFDLRTGKLVVDSAHYLPGDAHCCVSAMDIVTFQWNGRRFVERELRTELTEYGKGAGRTLPR